MGVELKSVSILMVDNEGNEDWQDYEVGDTEEVGKTMHSVWTVKKIYGYKTGRC